MSLWRRIFEERKGVLLPLAIVLIANVAVLILAVLPLGTAVTSAADRAVDAMRDLGEARRQQRLASQARTSKEQAEQELRRFSREILPPDFATAEKTANLWLASAAQEAGLTFNSSQTTRTEIRDSRLSKVTSRVTLEGRYPNIRRFLHDIETAKEFVIVEKVELAETGDQPGSNSGLEVALVVSTYFVTKQPS